MTVRDWPWWRLLVRVTPLLNVHRTEEQLKIANDELTALKVKLEKLENERNSLKTDNLRMESKVSSASTFTPIQFINCHKISIATGIYKSINCADAL
jgi:myosin-18